MTHRSKQILACAPRVRKVARDLAGPALPYVDCRDLEQDGWLALLQASHRYDGTTKFATFVALRLQGAMIDGLRRWNPRHRQGGGNKIDWRPLPDTATETVVARGPSAETQLLAAELRTLVTRLPDRQRHVITRLFLEEASPVEVAGELQITTSRVVQIRRAALDDLRWQLTGEA